MQADHGNDGTLQALRGELQEEHRRAHKRAKLGIGIRVVSIVFVLGYMSWLVSAVTKLDAPALTQLAGAHLESRIPELRETLTTLAIDAAPAVTDHARDLLLELPGSLRGHVEELLVAQTDRLIERFESDVDAAIGVVVEDQLELVRSGMPGAGPEEQLDAIILGVSDEFHDTMIATLDQLHEEYANEVQRLGARLQHLQSGDPLTADEQIDKQLIEAWMVLVHRRKITDPLRVVTEISRATE